MHHILTLKIASPSSCSFEILCSSEISEDDNKEDWRVEGDEGDADKEADTDADKEALENGLGSRDELVLLEYGCVGGICISSDENSFCTPLADKNDELGTSGAKNGGDEESGVDVPRNDLNRVFFACVLWCKTLKGVGVQSETCTAASYVKYKTFLLELMVEI